MALTFNKKHPSTDIKEGELIFTSTDANDAAVNYQVAALKVANITDPVVIVFDPRPNFNPSKKWFFQSKEFLTILGASAEIAGKFADKSEIGALENTVVANIFGSSQVLFTSTNATALGDTTITSVTKITDTSGGSSDSGSGNGSGSGSGSSNNPGTANASTDATTKTILGMAWYWAAGIGAVIIVGGVYVAKKLFGGKKKKPIDK
ncbi:hypothetical protein [Cellulophaga sp. BC115SP]|uniref:hypothetical protein n=1 Tax=Cellulophaga sp. BC115SP TaxID=2683263 RepID=UPI00141297AB|nr:hypothetical protein [Cellulophaga sp. BC115SP]NBB30647.1 hypothetical protein [Cellulophaga sp. BC115SP]